MTTKKVLELACLFLGKQEIIQTTLFNDSGTEPTQKNNDDIAILLKCLNLILSEIAIDYLPIVKHKVVNFANGQIDVKEIDPRMQEILSIKTNGICVPYKIYGSQICADCSSAEIEFKVHPQEVGLADTCEDFAGRIADRVIAYGVCMEFCFISLLHDDAQIWETKFKNALLLDCRKKGELRLKKRRFI